MPGLDGGHLQGHRSRRRLAEHASRRQARQALLESFAQGLTSGRNQHLLGAVIQQLQAAAEALLEIAQQRVEHLLKHRCGFV